jgi:hypothetical protein
MAADYGFLLLWNAASRELLERLHGCGENTMACAYSQSGNYALSGDITARFGFGG